MAVIIKKIFLISLILLSFTSCRKDIGKVIKPNTKDTNALIQLDPVYSFPCEDTALNRTKYTVSEWAKTISYHGKRSVWRVLLDQNDNNIIYYLTVEDNFPQHTLWKYNRQSKEKTYLDTHLMNEIEINKNGWLVYEKMDWNIYKIKTNGDSLTQLTFDGSSKFPKWTADGEAIWFVNDGAKSGGVFKMDKNGLRIDTLTDAASWVVEGKNNLYYLLYDNINFRLIQKNKITESERVILIIRENNLQGDDIRDYFESPDGQYIYWHGAHGLSKTNLTTLVSKRLINGGANTLSTILHYKQSERTKGYVAVQFHAKYIDYYTIETWNTVLEFTENGTCRRTVNLPD